jgi:hypothetical protein
VVTIHYVNEHYDEAGDYFSAIGGNSKFAKTAEEIAEKKCMH